MCKKDLIVITEKKILLSDVVNFLKMALHEKEMFDLFGKAAVSNFLIPLKNIDCGIHRFFLYFQR